VGEYVYPVIGTNFVAILRFFVSNSPSILLRGETNFINPPQKVFTSDIFTECLEETECPSCTIARLKEIAFAANWWQTLQIKHAVSVQIRGIAILFVLKWVGEIEFQPQ